MKKAFALLAALILLIGLIPAESFAASKTFTLMIYMCGTDLESNSSAATADLREMVNSGIKDNGNLTVYIQTGGTKKWHVNGMTNKKCERWVLTSSGISRVESAFTANMGSADTFADFLKYGFKNYKADRYGLIMWDHGSGATGGLCYDEMSGDPLYYPEIYSALKEASSFKNYKKFSFIGFDACLMASYELANHIAPFTDYMIASEEVEPGAGWVYNKWLPTLAKNPGIDIPTLGKAIVDSFVSSNSSSGSSFFSSYSGEYATLSVCDLSKLPALNKAVEKMAESLNDEIANGNFSTISKKRQNVRSFGETSASSASDMIDMSVFYSIFSSFDKTAANNVKKALADVVLYSRHTNNLDNISGLSILVPYRTRKSASTYMKYYETLALSPNYADFVRSMTNSMNSGSSSSLSNVGVGSTSLQGAQVDWFSQYASDQDSYYSSADSIWGSLFGGSLWDDAPSSGTGSSLWDYGTGNDSGSIWDFSGSTSQSSQQTSATDDWLGSFLSGMFGSTATGGFNDTYDSTSSGLWGDLSDMGIDSSFGVSSGSSSGTFGSSSLDGFLDDLSQYGVVTPAPQTTAAPAQTAASSSSVTVDTANGSVTLNNPFANATGEYTLTAQLDKEQMDELGSVEAVLMMDISDPDFPCYVDLGHNHDVVVNWTSGKIYGLFNGTWGNLDGQMVPVNDQIANERYVRSLIPVTVNDRMTNLLVIFDESTPNGRVTGYTDGYTVNGLPDRIVNELQPGDIVVPQYELIYWDYDGEQQAEPFEGDPIEVDRKGEISFTRTDVESDATYLYGFQLTDIYGDTSYSDFIKLTY